MLHRLFIILAAGVFIGFPHSLAVAEGAAFETCVYSLFNVGGLSKAQARKECLKGLSAGALHCQNRRFLNFENPDSALSFCRERQTTADLQKFTMYRGVYEASPNDPTRKNVCSITVNSSEEREAFRAGLDPKRFNWIELLPSSKPPDRFIPRDDFWLKRACAQKLRCDILVVSGHFASTFLGSSGFEIQIEDLTKSSCDSGCKEFFSSIEEVYLFGCNTLASRNRDRRTPGQYVDILTEDGVSPHQAQQIAARRYTTYNQTIREEIRKIFFNANKIFGYPELSPTGPNVKRTLQSYLQSGDFARTLGRTGMIRTYGVRQEVLSCEAKADNLRDAAVSSAAGLGRYIREYGRDLPVPSADLVSEALAKRLITNTEAADLYSQLINAGSENRKMRRHRLCPLVLTSHKAIVPTELRCVEDDSWLHMPKP